MPSTAADSRRQSHHIPASMHSQPPSHYPSGQIQQSYPTHNTLDRPINISERPQILPMHGTGHYNPQQSLDSVSSNIGSRNHHLGENSNMNATGSYINVPYDIWLQQQMFDSSQQSVSHSGTLSDSYSTAESQLTNLIPQSKINTQPNSSYPASTNRKFSLVEKNRNSHLGPPQTYSQIKHGRNSQNTNSVISNYNQHRQPTSFIPRHTNQVQKLHPNHNTKNQSTYQSYTPPPHPRSFTPYLAPIEEQVRRKRSSQGYKPTEKKSSLGTKDRYDIKVTSEY
ncbi:hypothetical protein BKA69DRAFT_377430 [Paraphysoderma sedebokerense]|nr:hypothetical protein BKA69DRAFT_377430 [Paraphysoderma sedebokerense]